MPRDHWKLHWTTRAVGDWRLRWNRSSFGRQILPLLFREKHFTWDTAMNSRLFDSCESKQVWNLCSSNSICFASRQNVPLTSPGQTVLTLVSFTDHTSHLRRPVQFKDSSGLKRLSQLFRLSSCHPSGVWAADIKQFSSLLHNPPIGFHLTAQLQKLSSGQRDSIMTWTFPHEQQPLAAVMLKVCSFLNHKAAGKAASGRANTSNRGPPPF